MIECLVVWHGTPAIHSLACPSEAREKATYSSRYQAENLPLERSKDREDYWVRSFSQQNS